MFRMLRNRFGFDFGVRALRFHIVMRRTPLRRFDVGRSRGQSHGFVQAKGFISFMVNYEFDFLIGRYGRIRQLYEIRISFTVQVPRETGQRQIDGRGEDFGFERHVGLMGRYQLKSGIKFLSIDMSGIRGTQITKFCNL